MKKNILFITFSLLMMLVWVISLMDVNADKFTCFLALVYTCVGTYFLQKKYQFSLSRLEFFLIVSFPLLYIISYYFLHFKLTIPFFLNPIFFALTILILNLFVFRDLGKLYNLFIFSFFISLYSYSIFPIWNQSRFLQLTDNFDTATKSHPKQVNLLSKDVNLNDFTFINPNLDTVQISLDKDFILLESWNETCPPCIKAMRDLPSFYKEHQDKMKSFYVYEHHKPEVRKNFNKIFDFKHIQEKDKIIIDIDQKLYKKLDISTYPVFLLFDKKGDLVFYQKGYSQEHWDKTEKEILSFINK